MSSQFTGTYTPRLDDKGRLTLPAKFRAGLAGGLMVTKGQDHSLALYPKEEFAARAARAAAAARTSVSGRAYLRSLTAGADEQTPDGQGRITLSAEHRRYALLTKDCVVNGTWDFVEIWDAATWRTYSDEAEEAFAQAVEPADRP